MTLQGLIERMTFEVNPTKDVEMLSKIIGHKQVKKHILQRIMCFSVLIILWLYINGGLFTLILSLRCGWGNTWNVLDGSDVFAVFVPDAHFKLAI